MNTISRKILTGCVCAKIYFLKTLDISGRKIQWFLENKFPTYEDKRGKHVKKKASNEGKEIIRNHIKSFPKVETHYCRASVKREYIDPCLSVSKMYDLYVFHCNSKGIIPEKLYTYRNIFNNDFNLGFHMPTKDRCDLCEEYKISQNVQDVRDQLNIKKYDAHIQSKVRTKMERYNDRTSEKAVLCFDLENLITCPQANISVFFYKRKLNVYNLTATCHLINVLIMPYG